MGSPLPHPARLVTLVGLRPGPRLAGALLAVALIWTMALRPAAVRPVAADSPNPSPQVGDTRSSGEGAGAAGDPLGAVQALVVVVGLGLGAAGATVLYVRLSRRGP